jgi:thiamine kinase-like enzyme
LASNADNEVLTMIDFEYGGWNPAAFDIANYFNEMTFDNAAADGIRFYPNNFPTGEQRTEIIKLYMEEWHRRTGVETAFEEWYQGKV